MRRPFWFRPVFVCPKCGIVSYNPNDIREQYCAKCRLWFEDESVKPKRDSGQSPFIRKEIPKASTET